MVCDFLTRSGDGSGTGIMVLGMAKKTQTQWGKPKTDLNRAGSGMINGDGDGENRIILQGRGRVWWPPARLPDTYLILYIYIYINYLIFIYKNIDTLHLITLNPYPNLTPLTPFQVCTQKSCLRFFSRQTSSLIPSKQLLMHMGENYTNIGPY